MSFVKIFQKVREDCARYSPRPPTEPTEIPQISFRWLVRSIGETGRVRFIVQKQHVNENIGCTHIDVMNIEDGLVVFIPFDSYRVLKRKIADFLRRDRLDSTEGLILTARKSRAFGMVEWMVESPPQD